MVAMLFQGLTECNVVMEAMLFQGDSFSKSCKGSLAKCNVAMVAMLFQRDSFQNLVREA